MPFEYNSGAINLNINVDLKDISGNDLHPMLDRLQKRSIGQTAIKWNADLGGAGVTGALVTSDITSDNTDTNIVPASLAIGTSRLQHRFSVLTTKLAEAANVGQGALNNLMAVESKAAMKQIMRSVATEIYAGEGLAADGGIIGLSQLHANVTSSLSTDDYAGIDVSTYANWSTYVNSNAGVARNLTDDLMFQMSEEIIGGATLGVNSNFTAIYTTPALATKYKGLFQAVSDFNINPNGVADLGYSGLAFEGRPIFVDPYCPAGTMYFVDESELYLYTYREGASAYGDEETENGINFKLSQLPSSNPDAVIFSIVLKPQLCVERRAAVAVLEDLQ